MAANLAVANGTGVSIALIDGSIDPSVPELANATIKTQPSECVLNGSTDPVNSTTDATHGTQMAVMLAGNGTGNWDGQGSKGVAPGATILHYRNSTDRADGKGTECLSATGNDIFDQATANAINDAVLQGARVVNMSFGTNGAMSVTTEAIGAAERKGVVFVGSTDDKGTPSSPDRLNSPGDLNGVVLMNGLAPDATPTLAPNSSNSPIVSMVAPGERIVAGGFNPNTGKWDSTGVSNGSSLAAAFTSGVVADAMSRWPQATGNQIIQLMVRTTGGSFHEPYSRAANGGFGFGTVSLTTMFDNDPMQMPDENPLLRDDADPSTASITGSQPSSTASATASSSSAPASAASSGESSPRAAAADDSSSSWPLYLGIGVAVLVVLAIVVAVLVMRSRRKPPPGGPPSAPGAWSGPPGGPPIRHPTI